MSIEKIRNIGLDKLVTQVYDFDSLTTDELMCKFAQKINIIIEHFNYLDDRCYNSDKALELKLDYLLNQGLEEQLAKKLLELINNGTLGKLINETLLKNINDKVDNFKVEVNEELIANKTDYTNKIKNLSDDKRIFKPTFGHCVDWSFRTGNGGNWGEETIKAEIDSLKNFGVEEISVTIQTTCRNEIVALVSDLDLFKTCLDYAKEKGITTSMVKIHCNEFRDIINTVSDTTNLFSQWYALVENVSNSFKGYCKYFVPLNEGEHIFKENKYETFLTNCLNICKEKGFKVGFTPSTALQWDNLPETVRYLCDFISFNCYPSISLKGLETTYGDVVNAFEEYQLNQWINSHKEMYDKEIIITEIGVEDRPSCLAATYVWDFGNGETYQNGKVQKIMLKGIFESLKDNDNLSKIYYWFPFRGNAVNEIINYYVGGATNE